MTPTFTLDELRVMAAATELLDALKTARRVLVVREALISEALEVIDAALAKAEGTK